MSPLVKVSLRFGLIAGALGFLLCIGLYYLGTHPFLLDVYIDYRIFLFGIFLFFTLKELRDLHYNGILYFWQAMASAFLFVIAYAWVASVAIWLFGLAVPEFVGDYIRLYQEKFRAMPAELVEKIGKDVYDRNLQMIPSTNALDLAILYFGQCFIIGFFISLILSVIVRRQPKLNT